MLVSVSTSSKSELCAQGNANSQCLEHGRHYLISLMDVFHDNGLTEVSLARLVQLEKLAKYIDVDDVAKQQSQGLGHSILVNCE